jgi:hypothetical protein
MTLADISLLLFTVFNGLRIVSYIPQIVRVARDANGASAISYSTWGMWFAANSSTALYAFVNIADQMMGMINLVNALCCGVVIALTAYKRRCVASASWAAASRRPTGSFETG